MVPIIIFFITLMIAVFTIIFILSVEGDGSKMDIYVSVVGIVVMTAALSNRLRSMATTGVSSE